MVIAAFLGLGWYVLIAGLLFKTWLDYAHQDTKMTPNQKIISWVMLLLGTMFWGITLPLAYLELLKQRSATPDTSVSSTL